MFELLIIAGTLFGSDTDRLGASDWYEREAAEFRLRACGPLAIPALWRAERSECQEVRTRAAGLLRPWRSLAADLHAAAVLVCPWEYPPARLYADEDLRRRLYRIARANRCYEGYVVWLLPEQHESAGIGWFANWMPQAKVAGALRRARWELGYGYLEWARLPGF